MFHRKHTRGCFGSQCPNSGGKQNTIDWTRHISPGKALASIAHKAGNVFDVIVPFLRPPLSLLTKPSFWIIALASSLYL